MIGFYNYTVWLTYVSLMSGVTGITLCFVKPDKPILAVICLLISGCCDLFDGKVARTKKDRTAQEKSFGIQIDSLVDLICFGVLPAVIMVTMASNVFENTQVYWFIPLAVMFVLFGMIRLAYFNVLEIERQATEEALTNSFFWGVPITASAIVMPVTFLVASSLFNHELIGNLAWFLAYAVMLFILGVAFVVKVKVPKFKKKGAIVLISIGLAVLIAFILLEIL